MAELCSEGPYRRGDPRRCGRKGRGARPAGPISARARVRARRERRSPQEPFAGEARRGATPSPGPPRCGAHGASQSLGRSRRDRTPGAAHTGARRTLGPIPLRESLRPASRSRTARPCREALRRRRRSPRGLPDGHCLDRWEVVGRFHPTEKCDSRILRAADAGQSRGNRRFLLGINDLLRRRARDRRATVLHGCSPILCEVRGSVLPWRRSRNVMRIS